MVGLLRVTKTPDIGYLNVFLYWKWTKLWSLCDNFGRQGISRSSCNWSTLSSYVDQLLSVCRSMKLVMRGFDGYGIVEIISLNPLLELDGSLQLYPLGNWTLMLLGALSLNWEVWVGCNDDLPWVGKHIHNPQLESPGWIELFGSD